MAFRALVTPTTQGRVTAKFSQGDRNSDVATPWVDMIHVTRASATSLTTALVLRMSSHTPTSSTMSPPTMIDSARASEDEKTINDTAKASHMAGPAMRGVARVWNLPASGSSIILRRRSRRMDKPVSARLTTNASPPKHG